MTLDAKLRDPQNWPSIQTASAMLFWRIYEAQVAS